MGSDRSSKGPFIDRNRQCHPSSLINASRNGSSNTTPKRTPCRLQSPVQSNPSPSHQKTTPALPPPSHPRHHPAPPPSQTLISSFLLDLPKPHETSNKTKPLASFLPPGRSALLAYSIQDSRFFFPFSQESQPYPRHCNLSLQNPPPQGESLQAADKVTFSCSSGHVHKK